MYSMLLPLDANAQRHNDRYEVPPDGNWFEAVLVRCSTILRAVFRRR
jgi:hypothetical protein